MGTKGRAFEWAHTPQTTGKGLEPGGAAGQSSVRSGRSVVTPVFGFSEACARAWQDLINGIWYLKKIVPADILITLANPMISLFFHW